MYESYPSNTSLCEVDVSLKLKRLICLHFKTVYLTIRITTFKAIYIKGIVG